MVFWYLLASEIKFDIRFALGMIFQGKTRLIHKFIRNLIEIQYAVQVATLVYFLQMGNSNNSCDYFQISLL